MNKIKVQEPGLQGWSVVYDRRKFDFRKRCAIVGLSIGNVFGLILRFMPNWWSFLICWVVVMVFNHVAYIAATVYIVEIVGPSKEGILEPVSAFAPGNANDRE